MLALLAVSAVAIASPALAQSAPQPPEPQPTGSARITGQVLAKDNRAAVRRAYVRLAGVPAITVSAGSKPAYVQREVQTDDNGTFDFVDLPPGSYSISVPATNGFLELARARQAVVGQGRALVVSIRLERTGAIVGRITDRNARNLQTTRRSGLVMTYYPGQSRDASWCKGLRSMPTAIGRSRTWMSRPLGHRASSAPLMRRNR